MADFGGNKPFLDFSTFVKPCRVTPHLKDNGEHVFGVRNIEFVTLIKKCAKSKANFLLIFNGLKQNKD